MLNQHEELTYAEQLNLSEEELDLIEHEGEREEEIEEDRRFHIHN